MAVLDDLMCRAAEAQLGRSAEEIARRGFLGLFDDPDFMLERINERTREAASGIRAWGERLFSVRATTIRSGEVISSAALIRDNTEDKQLVAQL